MRMNDDDFRRLLKRELDAGLEKMDGATTSKLARIRHKAVARRAAAAGGISRFAPAIAFAASTAVFAILLRVPGGTIPRFEQNALLVEFVLAEGELELIEDLEFFRWLDANGYAG